MNLFWARIYDVIIKSFLAGENHIFQATKKVCLHKTNCFEVFGYDILLDSDLKPWLVEINLSPSLACDSALDHQIKTSLLTDTFNMIGVKKFDRRKEQENKMKNRIKSYNNRGKSALASNGISYPQMFLKDKPFFGISNTSNINASAYNHQDNFYNSPNSDLMDEIEKKADLD